MQGSVANERFVVLLLPGRIGSPAFAHTTGSGTGYR
jgi:hypothetical protein